ncbi:MAG TPA: DUF4105 domain-containing protein [Edaphocola sp.]|nr:DUF4105 domain-containing protein [Edaphocola sp.]
MKLILSLFLSLFIIGNLNAQDQPDSIEISLLTCGTGDELYSLFGHSAVRVVNHTAHTDEIYNYGLFDFWDPDFYVKFTTGKLLYFVGKDNYLNFLYTYEAEKRSVIEQQLNVNEKQKLDIIHFLEQNLLPENRAYRYDFLFDNCATRIRDIFPKELGKDFKFGNAIATEQSISFRNILNEYLKNSHWARLGINIIFGNKVDKKMSNEAAMFLPDLLMAGISTSTFQNQAFVSSTQQILEGTHKTNRSLNQPLWVMMSILLITMAVFFFPKLEKFRKIIAFLFLFITGILGCFLIFAWFGTEHQTFSNNFNLLWALPFNLMVSFTIFKARSWHKNYSIIALLALSLSVLISLTGIQEMPLLELIPFFFIMLYTYLYLNKRSKAIIKN